ncbi:LamG domain-containing protein [Streptomyces sp. NPDC047985]|uniref:LamG domain-containing protein n=1 Tax=Streptomyces sp. NPDC047985 TaxID=3155384 RepID=UPI0034344DAE
MSRRTGRSLALRASVAAVAAGAVLTTGLAWLPQTGGTAGKQAEVASTATVQTENQALAAARKSGTNVEVLGLRTERREIFAEPDGTFTAREYTNPIRTVRNGAWADIDETLVKHADGSWGPKASTVEVTFSAGQADKPFVTMRRAGRELALTWLYGKLPAPQVEGDTATYADALPGVDLKVRAEADGFGHLLVVKTPEAAENPQLARLDLGLTADGLNVKEDAAGALKAEDAAVGGTVFEAGKPGMWDSSAVQEAAARSEGPQAVAQALASSVADAPAMEGQKTAPAPALEGPGGGGKAAPLDIEVAEGKLTLIPDQKLLKGSDTVFPVVIDPIQRTTSRTAWTGVMSGMPGEQDWKYSDSAGVGRCPTDYNPVSCNGVGVRRLLFTMPMSFYKGKQILGASFNARVAHIYSASPTAEPIQLYRIGGKNYSITSGSDWSNTKDDWSDYLQTVDKAISPTSCSSQANLHFESGATGELTSEVKAAAAGGWSSMTFGLRAADESRFPEWKRICGNAYLSISYNNLPRQIKTTDMFSNPGGICAWGANRPYADVPPQLQAIASDPDHANGQTDKVKVQFKVAWTPKGATAETSYTYDTSYLAPTANTKFTHTVKSTIPEGVVIYWSARANDGDGWGPWSHDGDTPQRCEFMYDKTYPGKPNVLSREYPSDTVYHDGVGTYGTFTFAPNPNDSVPDTDIVKYRYAFDGTANPTTTVTASTAGGPASVTWMPSRAGRHWVDVIAVDKAEHPSAKQHYEFLVTEGAPVAGQWNLADEAGSEAHDESGEFPADVGTGVTFGAEGPGGKVDSAASFDGSAGAYLDVGETVIDSSKGFSVSAWVRPTALDRSMAVVSQDGTGEPGFTLGYDATAGTWAFSVPVTDVDTIGEWKAVATGVSVVKDQWVLLTGVYDAQTTELRLYVNETSKGVAARRTVWKSYGPLQIGRATAKSGYRDNFTGDIAEVRVFDRVLPAAQVAELKTVKPQRKGYWQLDSATDGVSAETGNGEGLTLVGNASIYRPADPLFDTAPLVGEGHLVLDGDGDHSATATPPVTGGSSFTISARALLTSLDATKSQTVLSLPGTAANRFQVRYQAATQQWELAVAQSDSTEAEVKTFTDDQELPDTGGSGQHLAVVYDAFANEIRLYVNGQLASTAHGAEDSLWAATGGLQVGRSALGGGSEYFAGAIDEVRAYTGAADVVAIRQMAALTALPDM